jgi:hypothetical protein
MKTKILLLTMFAANLLFAQKTEKCATMTQYHKHVANNPQLIEKRKEIETFTQNWIRSQNSQKRGTRNVVTIPVVVHVIHAGEPIGTGTNISDAQIYSQIDILNEDFRLLNADSLDSNHPFWVDAADSEIEFCLAQQDEDGFATNGINRVDGLAEFGYDSWWNQEEVDTLVKPATQWDPLSYLNIWVVAFDPNGDAADLLGYANFPDEHGFDHDGVVIRYEAFGDEGTAGTGNFTGNNLGRTATHEIGHYFNLRHIWGDTICGDDFVADTPPQEFEEGNSGCPTFPHNAFNTCGSDANGEMYMNYMDYVDDDCMNMFTFGQADRMDAAIFGPRASLLSSVACQTPVSVKENKHKTTFRIYPNPTENIFNIQFNNTVEAAHIKLVDMAGKVVMSKSVNNTADVSVNVSSLAPGMYFVKAETSNNLITSKIFVK